MRTYVDRHPKRIQAFCWNGTLDSITNNLTWSELKKHFLISANFQYSPGSFDVVHRCTGKKIEFKLREKSYTGVAEKVTPIKPGDYIAKDEDGTFTICSPQFIYDEFKEV